MLPLYTEQSFQIAKSSQLFPLRCKQCEKTFYKTKHNIKDFMNPKRQDTGDFCSHDCAMKSRVVFVVCLHCGKNFSKQRNKIEKTKNNFCCQSCSAKYSNAHKTKGTRISKLERWLAEQLQNINPSIEFHFNRKDAINGELDIFIPSLNLAFELNGIFHYEPIYGPDKLASIQTNDHRKMQACFERGIELCIIDTSREKYFKETTSKKYLDIITNLIHSKIQGISQLSLLSGQNHAEVP